MGRRHATSQGFMIVVRLTAKPIINFVMAAAKAGAGAMMC
jgi:hypothetical protein